MHWLKVEHYFEWRANIITWASMVERPCLLCNIALGRGRRRSFRRSQIPEGYPLYPMCNSFSKALGCLTFRAICVTCESGRCSQRIRMQHLKKELHIGSTLYRASAVVISPPTHNTPITTTPSAPSTAGRANVRIDHRRSGPPERPPLNIGPAARPSALHRRRRRGAGRAGSHHLHA